jgi:high-affinity Fe2+/Pb2+ permease
VNSREGEAQDTSADDLAGMGLVVWALVACAVLLGLLLFSMLS